MTGPIEKLHRRCGKLGIDLRFVSNYPWIYLDTINGKRVKERFLANHGFTVAFHPIRFDQPLKLTDTKEIFALIRKYTKDDRPAIH